MKITISAISLVLFINSTSLAQNSEAESKFTTLMGEMMSTTAGAILAATKCRPAINDRQYKEIIEELEKRWATILERKVGEKTKVEELVEAMGENPPIPMIDDAPGDKILLLKNSCPKWIESSLDENQKALATVTSFANENFN